MFKISQERLKEMAKIEEEANCDISAGFDWGEDTVKYLQSVNSCVSQKKLLEILREDLGDTLDAQDIEEIAIKLLCEAQNLVDEKIESVKSA